NPRPRRARRVWGRRTRHHSGVLLRSILVAFAFLFVAPGAAPAAIWHPAPTPAAWQWQLQGRIDTGVDSDVYDVDGFETSKATVRALHHLGRKAICYLDV